MKEIIIPIFALTALFVIPAIIGLIAVLKWFQSRDRLYQSIDEAIEKNASPEVISQLVSLTESKESREPKSSRIKRFSDAAFWLAMGVGFIVFYYHGGPKGVIFPGVFMSLYGLILLGIAAFVAKDDKSGKDDKAEL